LAADGIENCIQVLDQIENGTIHNLEFVELNACTGGCVGGALTMQNPFIAKARMQTLRRYLPVSLNHIENRDDSECKEVIWDTEVSYSPVTRLASSRSEAARKMVQIQQIRETLCNLDCGSCGAPTCRALAEDVVKGLSDIDKCLIKKCKDQGCAK
jgi:ArsR family metal-binding transcriptional regulator